MPSSLGFLTSRQILSARKEHHLGRHDRCDKGQQYQRDVRWQSIVARNRKQVDLSLGLWSVLLLDLFCEPLKKSQPSRFSTVLKVRRFRQSKFSKSITIKTNELKSTRYVYHLPRAYVSACA
jgi:hypothetical protein